MLDGAGVAALLDPVGTAAYGGAMKSLELEVPDYIAAELDALVKAGLYPNAQEAVRHALREFLRHHASALAEKHQREDIAWALRETQSR
jgi:Arc/MetJ-type ribon-helix-helix transcriptional regulator